MTAPSLRVERALLRHEGEGAVLAAIDEVGRGALAGPVSVGIVLITLDTASAPTGVRDSKLLTPAVREALVPRIRRWAVDSAVGHASNDEIDEVGIVAGLRRAGQRALAELAGRGHVPSRALLDGSHDWLTCPQASLFDVELADVITPPVTMRVKADLTCAAVAAASVLAKVERDAMMAQAALAHPGYGWADNKGYAAPEHRQGLATQGVSPLHRRSWNLSTGEAPDPQELAAT